MPRPLRSVCHAALAVILLASLLTAGSPLRAQPAPPLDTVSVRPVGPGVTYLELAAPAVPWMLDVLVVDLRDPALQIETATAGGALGTGTETVSAMARRHDAPGHRVVAAVNTDFSGPGDWPASIQIQDGQIVRDETTYYGNPRPAIGFGPDNRVMMEVVHFSGEVATRDSTLTLDDVNTAREAGQLVLYNRFAGPSTGTGEGGVEVAVRLVEGARWLVNNTVRVVAEAVVADGDTPIPAGGAVISGQGTPAEALARQVVPGDTLTLALHARPGLDAVAEMAAGYPFLVRDGRVDVGPRGDGDERHPRTAVGFSADSTKLYLVTVDGRQAASAGIRLPVLAELLVRMGVHTAMNFDGGGSTTMVVRDEVVNAPSGGTERPRPSALLVVTTAPEGALSRVQLTPTSPKVFVGNSRRFTVRGTDDAFHPVALDPDRVVYEVDPGLGTITPDGRFTASMEADTGRVYVRYGMLRDTARVVVTTLGRFTLAPRTVVTDTTRTVTFDVTAFDQDGLRRDVPPSWFTWTTTDPEVGTVDGEGRFRGLRPGTTAVVAAFGTLRDTVRVEVDVRAGTALIAALDDTTGWRLEGEGIDRQATTLERSNEIHSQGEAALRVDYRFTYDPTGLNWVYLETDRAVPGVPDSVFIDVRSDQALQHRVFIDVVDADGHSFRIYTLAYADATDRFAVLPGAVERATPRDPAHATLHFPLRLERLALRLASAREAGATYTGTLYLDHLRVSYPAQRAAAEAAGAMPTAARLLPAYPNPFTRAAAIPYVLPRAMHVRLTLYDVLGRHVRTLVDTVQPPGVHTAPLDGAVLPAGTYFVRLEAGRAVATGTLLRVR